MAQHIGALDYLLPQEYVQTCKVTHHQAPEQNIEDVYKVMVAELKKEPSEIFSSFDEKPLGSASLAQVHRATLRSDGREVAVKVQHLKVKQHSFIDIYTEEKTDKLKPFTFNVVFEPEASQEDILEHSGIRRLIDMSIDGFSATCFCYGQTGSGKTHTLTGPPHLVSNTVLTQYEEIR